MRGKIITITGSDGSGKETQTQLLMNRALAEGYRIKTMSFPNYDTPTGKEVRKYLAGARGGLYEIDPKKASEYFANDRLAAKPTIEQWLKDGYNIIFDRYVESNYAYQAAKFIGNKRRAMLDWLYDLEIIQNGLPDSDFVLYLDLPLEFGQKSLKSRNKKKDEENKKDIHEDNLNFLAAVEETYRYLVAKHDNWMSISCLKTEDERHTEDELCEIIWRIMQPHLVQ